MAKQKLAKRRKLTASPKKRAPLKLASAAAKKPAPEKAPAGPVRPAGERKFRKLSHVEHVRLRTGMWLGQNSMADTTQHFFIQKKSGYTIEHEEVQLIPAVWKCLDEACMNCIDEYRKNLNDKKLKPGEKMNRLEVALSDDRRTVTVTDNGRGIPAANTEGVFMHLMYGENFDDLAQSDHVAGQNGVGISLVRMASQYFKASSSNAGTEYTRVFTVEDDFRDLLKKFGLSHDKAEEVALHFDEHGNIDKADHLTEAQKEKCRALMKKNLMTEKVKSTARSNHGVTVQFRLNPKYFNGLSVAYDAKLFRQYVQDLAMTNPGLRVVLRHKKSEETFLFKKGLEEIFHDSNIPYYKLSYKTPTSASQIDLAAFVVIGQNKTLTWVNSNHTSLGGSSIEYLENRICDEVRKKPAITSLENKLKTTSTRNDVRNCFHMYVDLRVLNPRFKSQDKSYLINDLNEEMRQAVDQNLDKLLKKTGLMDEVKAQIERRTQLKALEDAEKGLRKARRDQIPKLISATGGPEDGTRMLFITEGDSAVAGLRPVRNPKIHGLFPLRGKPMNVKGMSLAKALANEEIKNIVAILGLPMKTRVKSPKELNYQKVSIITDADFDGYAIRSLVLSLFYEYWPELFSMGVINITTAPLYEVEVERAKKRELVFCIDDNEYEKLIRSVEKTGGRLVRKKRNKGLGESSVAAMKYAVEQCLWEIRVDTPKKSGSIQNLWFHKDMAEQRRRAISEYTGTIYDEN